ncbi:ATP-binding protein [Streptacidiphilus sp. MAP5-52]|uniref:SCO6881 family protein n=1 Tax=Streptacidiphilus sp. MAP5-52 TaxID=3156267 RepID=UPI003514AF81
MGFCDLPGAGLLCDVTPGGVTDSITSSIGNWIASSLGDLAVSATNMAATAINNTTVVDLNASWFRANYAMLLPIGLTILVATFCMQLARAAIRRDGQALTQAVTGTITGVLFAMTAFIFTSVALTVVDGLSAGLFSLAGTSMSDAVRRVIKVGMITTAGGLGWTIAAVAALCCAVGAILYWGVMIFRKVSILILVTLAIFAGAGGGWEPAARWRKQWIETTATLVFSKLIMTVIFILGVSAIGNSDTKDGTTALSDIIAGMVVMLLVLLCPMALYKFMHWAGDSGAHELHRTASTGLSTASNAAKKAAQMAITKGASAKGGGGAPQGPSNLGGEGSSQSGSPEGGATMPTSFKFPGTSGSKEGGGSGQQISNQPLIRRPGQATSGMNPQADTTPSGDGGTPLISRGSSSTPPSGAGSGGGSTPGSSTAAPGVPAGSAGGSSSSGSNPSPAGGSAVPQSVIPASTGPQVTGGGPAAVGSAPASRRTPAATAAPNASTPPAGPPAL